MRARTTSFTEPSDPLTYAPHRLQTTAASLPNYRTAYRSIPFTRRKQPPVDHPSTESGNDSGLVEGLRFLSKEEVADLYREHAVEDRQLAEEGLEDYRVLLASADEA